MMNSQLTDRWYPLGYNEKQAQVALCDSRFKVLAAGRRSGKTELMKREGVCEALDFDSDDGWFVFSAPTHKQAKRIFWADLKKLVPREFQRGRPSESELTIRLINGSEITVLGLDAPERIEGRPLDWICCDEYANMKEKVWSENLRPALSTRGRRPGRANLIGVPEGRNHYYKVFRRAKAGLEDWSAFHWKSSEILRPEEIEAARRELDELTYRQEYEADFVNFSGQAYYAFSEATHCYPLKYDPSAELIFGFDFNVSPGTASVMQELKRPPELDHVTDLAKTFTGVIGEVHIPQNSTTPAVCRKLAQDWGHHKGRVRCYGDASGGARGSAKVSGSDWDLIRDELKPVFGQSLSFHVPKANPRERARVNAVNTRLRTAAGEIRMLVDPKAAPNVVFDLEGVILLKGGSGEIDKKHDEKLTHLSDGIGYYIEKKHPTRKLITTTTRI